MTEAGEKVKAAYMIKSACRYQRGSELCQKLARSLQQLTTEEERGLFDFGARHGETAPLVRSLTLQLVGSQALEAASPSAHDNIAALLGSAVMLQPHSLVNLLLI